MPRIKSVAAAVVTACAVSGGTAAAAPPTFKTRDGKVVCFFEKPRAPQYVYCVPVLRLGGVGCTRPGALARFAHGS
jgi:hypothetical protein